MTGVSPLPLGEGQGEGIYTYDQNGNMTCRVEDDVTFKQTYNAENRISSIAKVNGDCETFTVIESWSYLYDGDGVRVGEAYFVGATLTSTKSYYFGGAYETHGDSTIRKYYSIAGQTVAMRDDAGLKYFLTDHLGSTLAVLDDQGEVLSETRYMPFGAVRDDVGAISQTDFGYTFQRSLPETGLIDYNARFYEPYINRFLQPDSVVPNPADPQSWNRYSYVLNQPTKYSDPSGHWPCGGGGLRSCFSLTVTFVKENYDTISPIVEQVANYAAYEVAERYFPATAKGNQLQISGSVTLGLNLVGEENIVTSADGKLMTFYSEGIGLGIPQASVSVTTGPIFGEGFDSPKDFTGGTTQWNGSVGQFGSVAADYWKSLPNYPIEYEYPYGCSPGLCPFKKPAPKVWGYDGGISIGGSPLPATLAVSIVEAKPTMREERQLGGIELLACRLLYQCGRNPYADSHQNIPEY